MTREKRLEQLTKFKKISCPMCGEELEDLLEYEQTTEEWEHQYYCNNCSIDININED